MALATCAFSLAFTLQVQPNGPALAANPPTCVIKGNINDRGERIYHLPGWTYYSRTVVNAARGERWFCTEAEARAAGWRPSRR